MRYYYDVVKVSTTSEYLTTTKAFDTKDKALATYHNDMSNIMKNENVYYAQAIVHDSDGGIEVFDVYGSLEQEETEE